MYNEIVQTHIQRERARAREKLLCMIALNDDQRKQQSYVFFLLSFSLLRKIERRIDIIKVQPSGVFV